MTQCAKSLSIFRYFCIPVFNIYKGDFVIMAPKVDKDTCVGCESCVNACPCGAISIVDGVAQIDEEQCADCLTCVDACPCSAIKSE